MPTEIKHRDTGAVLLTTDADLRGADLRGADLRGADLWGANLWGADLRDANLRDADLRGADLWGADLWGADLRDANLRDADLRDANLRDAKGIDRFPIATFGHRHFMQTTNGGLLQIGCQIRTFEQWLEMADELGAREGYSAMDIEIYKLHIAHMERVSKLLWNSKEGKA